MSFSIKRFIPFVFLLFLAVTFFIFRKRAPSGNLDWPRYGGNYAGNRYSSLDQINTKNVKDLKVAWVYDAAEPASGGKRKWPLEIQCQPIVVDGVLYGTTAKLKLFALNAATGKALWSFDPYRNGPAHYSPSRGLMFWQQGTLRRIYYAAGSSLYAVNAVTGKVVPDFGNQGSVDLHEGIGDHLNRDISGLTVDATSPGVIFQNTLIMGGRVSEYGDAAPGHIRGFDVLTGKLKWVFHTVPQPGEPGYETWPKEAWKFMGGANCWGGMVLDEQRGVVYMGTGSPSVDFYGGERPGSNLFGNCILALNARTGKLIWYYQTVHHDLWDRDIPCPPNLTTIMRQGKRVDAVVQATKDGLVFVLDRDTGKPLFPVEERPALTKGALPGEHPWPTQPFPTIPHPFSRQVFTESDITDRTPAAHSYVKEWFLKTHHGNKYILPSKAGTPLLGIGGGAEWPGNAIDPGAILYQNSNEMVWNLKMNDFKFDDPHEGSAGRSLFLTNCAVCHGSDLKGGGAEYPSLVAIGKRMNEKEISNLLQTGRGRMPSFQRIAGKDRDLILSYLLNPGKIQAESDHHHPASFSSGNIGKPVFPYIPPYMNNGYVRFVDPDGYPAIKPPWGTLNAIDLNTGNYLWTVPLGEYPELVRKGLASTGTENYGGPVVTAGGLLFIAGTYDEKIRAFDKRTGRVLWQYQLPAGGFATPVTYQVDGVQYVVIAAGGAKNGHRPGGKYIAFSLPY